MEGGSGLEGTCNAGRGKGDQGNQGKRGNFGEKNPSGGANLEKRGKEILESLRGKEQSAACKNGEKHETKEKDIQRPEIGLKQNQA